MNRTHISAEFKTGAEEGRRLDDLLLVRWAWALIFISIALRLAYLPALELFPEEAYYWNFAKHLDIGYLDHPPLSAWLIYLGTSLLGHNEFAVRIGALLCWMVAAFFSFKLTEKIFDRKSAKVSLLLMSVLPYFFANGFFISPDAPLSACWSAAIYFLYRAFSERSSRWWIFAGVGLGLGMISKYTICLVGFGALVFCLLHKPSRQWYFKVAPYAAIAVMLLLFSPVIYWNATHEWASFAFQSSRRVSGSVKFSLLGYLIDVNSLATPLGFLAGVWALLKLPRLNSDSERAGGALFIRLFALIPILIFGAYSCFHPTKLNWSAQAFLALIPALAAQITGRFDGNTGRFAAILLRVWTPVMVALLVIYFIVLQYLSFGFPFSPYSRSMHRAIGWRDLAAKVSVVAEELRHADGRAPILVGMDKHNIAAELAFYAPGYEIAGRALFGEPALMFEEWVPEGIAGSKLLMVSRSEKDLSLPGIENYFESLGPITKIQTEKGGSKLETYYYRVGARYSPK